MKLKSFIVASLIFIFSANPVYAVPLVNLPYFTNGIGANQAAINWMGMVNNSVNYADIRMGLRDSYLDVYLHIADRRLWYSQSPTTTDLLNWDSAVLYLSTQENGSTITLKEFKFYGGLSGYNPQNLYEAAFTGNQNGGWTQNSLSGFTSSSWRGDSPNNDTNDNGWLIEFKIPYSALGINGTPLPGSTFRAAIELHDRDGNSLSPEPTVFWPVGFNPSNPETWSTLKAGLPTFNSTAVSNPVTYTLRRGITNVTDAHVGGSTTCGGSANPDHFSNWGDLNYNGATQIAEQNQWDIADWPCFSKIYLNFDLSSLPANKTVQKATLTMYQFGNSDPTLATTSYIQVLSTSPNWSEQLITWNNAPQAEENLSVASVDPVSGTINWPGWKRDWDISYGLTKAYQAHKSTFAIVLYSADGDYHSGKYFTSSDEGDWDAVGRPTITLTLGDSITATATPSAKTGDINGDGVVNILDYTLLSNAFGTATTSADLNRDGTVNILDYTILSNNFGK